MIMKTRNELIKENAEFWFAWRLTKHLSEIYTEYAKDSTGTIYFVADDYNNPNDFYLLNK